MPRLAAALVFCLLGPAVSPPRLYVDLVVDGPPMPPTLEASAMDEVIRIWAPYGVDVQAPTGRDSRRDGAVRIAVRAADLSDRPTSTTALGSIRFFGDVPEPAIVMYPNAIEELVSTTTLAGRDYHTWSTGFRHRIMGRALGRALAHEMGHFLLRSRHHSPAGLMRSALTAADLVAPDRRPFALSAADRVRLASVAADEELLAPAAYAGRDSDLVRWRHTLAESDY